MSFRRYLTEQSINNLLENLNEGKMASSFIANGDNKKELLKQITDEEDCFFIKGSMNKQNPWYFLYCEDNGMSKEEIFKQFKKISSTYSIGTGAEDFTKLEIEEI